MMESRMTHESCEVALLNACVKTISDLSILATTNVNVFQILGLKEYSFTHTYKHPKIVIFVNDKDTTIIGSIFGESFYSLKEALLLFDNLPTKDELGFILIIDIRTTETTELVSIHQIGKLLQALLNKYTQFVQMNFVHAFHVSCNEYQSSKKEGVDEWHLLLMLSNLKSQNLTIISGLHLCELLRIFPLANKLMKQFLRFLPNVNTFILEKPCHGQYIPNSDYNISSDITEENIFKCFMAISNLIREKPAAYIYFPRQDQSRIVPYDMTMLLKVLVTSGVRLGTNLEIGFELPDDIFDPCYTTLSIATYMDNSFKDKSGSATINAKLQTTGRQPQSSFRTDYKPRFFSVLKCEKVLDILRAPALTYKMLIEAINESLPYLEEKVHSDELCHIKFPLFLTIDFSNVTCLELTIDNSTEEMLNMYTMLRIKQHSKLVKFKLHFRVSSSDFETATQMVERISMLGPSSVRYLSITGLPSTSGNKYAFNLAKTYPNVKVLRIGLFKKMCKPQNNNTLIFKTTEYYEPNYFMNFKKAEAIFINCCMKNKLNLPVSVRIIEFDCCNSCSLTQFTSLDKYPCKYDIENFRVAVKIDNSANVAVDKLTIHQVNGEHKTGKGFLFLRNATDWNFYLKQDRFVNSSILI
uniref:Elongator complex protein 6 n=1 Tax=Rhabditophanes sp. KR3021 TaxID=114890 RepID=A0AC35TJE8_9BILA